MRAVVEAREQRRRDEIAGMHHQGLRIARPLGPDDGRHPRHAAAFLAAIKPVDVVDQQKTDPGVRRRRHLNGEEPRDKAQHAPQTQGK